MCGRESHGGGTWVRGRAGPAEQSWLRRTQSLLIGKVAALDAENARGISVELVRFAVTTLFYDGKPLVTIG